MPSKKNQEIVASLQKDFEAFESVTFISFSGLDVASIQDFRKQLRENKASVRVVKNSLLKIAAKKAGIDFIPEEVFSQETAVVFSLEDAVSGPKIVSQAAKKNDSIKIKAGILPQKALSSSEVKQLAILPDKDQLRAQLVGVLSGPMRGLVTVLEGNTSALVRVLNAYKEKKAA